MEIKYRNTLDNELLVASKNQWKHTQRKSVKYIFLCISFSLVFFAWGLLKGNSLGFWNFKTSVGLAYGIIGIILLFGLYHSKTQWLLNCEKAIANKNEKLIEYIFKDEKIIIKEKNAYAEFGWDVITGYRVYNNFLFLYINSSQSSYFTIDRNDMAEANFATFLTFVSNKIPLTK